MNSQDLIIFFAVMALATFITRAAPFLLLKDNEDHFFLQDLSRLLPPMVMVVLVFFGFNQLKLDDSNFIVLAILAIALVVILQLVFRNALVSILVGTGVYVMGVQWMGI